MMDNLANYSCGSLSSHIQAGFTLCHLLKYKTCLDVAIYTYGEV
ncbi:hypothetical protein [Pontibacter sp. 172403-2]|nr:hypothetical protein [Pontibacter sp. 172403-2]